MSQDCYRFCAECVQQASMAQEVIMDRTFQRVIQNRGNPLSPPGFLEEIKCRSGCCNRCILPASFLFPCKKTLGQKRSNFLRYRLSTTHNELGLAQSRQPRSFSSKTRWGESQWSEFPLCELVWTKRSTGIRDHMCPLYACYYNADAEVNGGLFMGVRLRRCRGLYVGCIYKSTPWELNST